MTGSYQRIQTAVIISYAHAVGAHADILCPEETAEG